MKVSILSYIADGEEIIARCGNSTSSETPPSEYQITKEDTRKFIKTAKKIQYDGINFKCYEDDSKGFLILERNDYIIVILEKTHD